MDIGYLILITITVTLLLMFLQRTEKSKRRMVTGFIVLSFLTIRHIAFMKDDLHEETLIAFVLGFLLSGLFWLLLGRYNPVGTSDDIQVLGMDD